jgi:hypothetical protein
MYSGWWQCARAGQGSCVSSSVLPKSRCPRQAFLRLVIANSAQFTMHSLHERSAFSVILRMKQGPGVRSVKEVCIELGASSLAPRQVLCSSSQDQASLSNHARQTSNYTKCWKLPPLLSDFETYLSDSSSIEN